MRIIGFRLSKILGEKLKEPDEITLQINLDSNFHLGEVKKTENQPFSEETMFSIDFSNVFNFDEVGKIEFKGMVFFALNNDKEEIIKELEEKKSVSDNNLRKLVIDYALKRIHVDSFILEEKLGLPFHISSPKVNILKDKDDN